MFRPHEGARLYTRVLLESQEGRGIGMFAKEDIPCGAMIVDEIPAMLGPKQSSPLLCIGCLCPLQEPGYTNKYTSMRTSDHNQNLITENNNFTENTSSIPQCNFCGMPMCGNCFSQLQTFNSQDGKQCSVEKDSSVLYFHLEECKILQKAGFKNLQLKNQKAIQQIYSILSPLRLLVEAQKNPRLLDLEDCAEARKNTLLYHFNAMNVVKRIQNILKSKVLNDDESTKSEQLKFSSEEIHKVCGILDTNAYEIAWKGRTCDDTTESSESVQAIQGRGIFPLISRINHDCTPNCRKYFSVDQSTDGGNRITMVVKASRDISAGEELNISYTPPMLNTPVRQMILTQTKNFVCKCKRCMDPTEFGSCLSGLRCRDCGSKGEEQIEKEENIPMLLPIDPTNAKSDLICSICNSTMPSERAKMELDTVLKFVGQGKDDEDGKSTSPIETLETMQQMGRFLAPTHQIVLDLKLRFISQIENQMRTANVYVPDEETKEALQTFFGDILTVISKIAPGQSKIRGSISKRYHDINDRFNLQSKNLDANELLLPKSTIDHMFENDMTFAAKQNVDAKDLR